jgi:predicted RecB family nuclease
MNLPSVTQVISQVGRYWLNFDNVPPDRLEFACQRGSDFHRLAALYAQKLWIDEVPESCVGFFRSFTTWFDEFVEEVVLVEQPLVHPTLHYKGTPDAIVRIKGDSGLILLDWKTPRALSKSWRLQLAAYCELARVNGHPVERVASLQPHPDGGRAKYQGYTKSLTPDFAVFLSGLNWWRFFNAA